MSQTEGTRLPLRSLLERAERIAAAARVKIAEETARIDALGSAEPGSKTARP